MNQIEIIACQEQELWALLVISRSTFFESYAQLNTAENMQAYMDNAFTAEKIGKELSDPQSDFYFAKMDNTVVGYLKLNFAAAQTDLKSADSLEIERIYVRKSHQGLGIGKMMLEKALQIAKKKGLATVWLGVWEQNPAAIGFYESQGFVPFGKHTFQLGEEAQLDILMQRRV